MSRTQVEVRTRNWNNARLKGFCLNSSSLTPREKEIYEEMMALKKTLIEAWDENSEIFLGYPLPPFKCCICGKRSDKEHTLGVVGEPLKNYCFKHYNVFKEYLIEKKPKEAHDIKLDKER